MYRALYGFRSAEPSSLAFAAGETFLLLERSNQHWWLVTRAGSGETGYAPASYLQRLQLKLSQKDYLNLCGDIKCTTRNQQPEEGIFQNQGREPLLLLLQLLLQHNS